MDGHLSKVSASLKTIGATTLAVGGAAGAGLAYLGKAGADFEHTLASLAAVAKPTKSELAEISKTALAVGADFGFSSIEVAKAMEAMSKQGLDTSQVIAGIGGVAAAAAADGSSLEETMGGLLATLAGLGAGASDLQHIADVMAKAGDATAASIGSLSQSMSVFGPTARALGIPLESAIGQLALLQDAGIDASSAGTTLSAVYSKLAAPTKRTADELKSLGLSVADSFGNMKPPDQLLNEIFAATQKIEGNVGKAATITRLVGLESQKALLNVSAAVGSGKMAKVMGDLTSNVDGYATQIARLKQNSTTGDIAKLTASFEALQIEIFGLVSGDLRDLISGFTQWLNANKEVIASGIRQFVLDFKAALPEIVVWLERIGKAVAVFLAFEAAVSTLNTTMTVLNALMAANPMILLTYAIIGAIALIWAFWPEISAFFTQLWDGVVSLAKSVGSAISSFFTSIVDTVKPFFVGLTEYVVGLGTILLFPFRLAMAGWIAIAKFTIGVLMAIWSPIGAVLGQIWEGVVGIASSVWQRIVGVAQWAYGVFLSVWTPITEFFSGLWNGIASAFQSAMGWVMEKLQWLLEKGGQLVDLVRSVGRDEMDGDASNDLGSSLISPAERVGRSIEEHRSTSSAELTITAPPGVAALKQTSKSPGISLNLQPTGAF